MDPNIVLSTNRIHEAQSSIASIKIFMDQERPIRELLHLADSAMVNLHDARHEISIFRNRLHKKLKEEEEREMNCVDANSLESKPEQSENQSV